MLQLQSPKACFSRFPNVQQNHQALDTLDANKGQISASSIPTMYILPPEGSLSISTWSTFAIATKRCSRGVKAARATGTSRRGGSTWLIFFAGSFCMQMVVATRHFRFACACNALLGSMRGRFGKPSTSHRPPTWPTGAGTVKW